MLDEGAKGWLALIEAKRKEVADYAQQLKDEGKRNERLKPGKVRQASTAKLEHLEETKALGMAFIENETSRFFKEVFNVRLHQPVAVRRSNGSLTKAVYATQLIARQLANGMGVFTVTGDSATVDLHKGLPACEYLRAIESDDDWLVTVN